MADGTKATACPSGHMTYAQAPAVCEKNIFQLLRFTQPVENSFFFFIKMILSSQLATMRFELESTFINTLNKLNLRWMRDRITKMWPEWVAAAKQFAAEGAVRRQHRERKVH